MANVWTKFQLLLWKNFVQRKRHKLQIVLEIFLPVIFILLPVYHRTETPPRESSPILYKSVNASYFHIIPEEMENSHSETCQVNVILYSPRSPAVRLILEKSFKHIFYENFDDTKHSIDCHYKSIDQSDTMIRIGKNDETFRRLFIFREYSNASELERNMLKPIDNDTNMCGIQFKDTLIDLKKLKSWPEHTDLILRFPSVDTNYYNMHIDWKTGVAYPPTLTLRNQYSYSRITPYIESGLTAVAHSIFREITILKTNIAKFPDVVLSRFPYTQFIKDRFSDDLRLYLGILMVICFSYNINSSVKSIAVEKEKQLKEVLKIMGLSNWMHWTAWFISTYSCMFISTIIITILFKINFRSEREDGSILTYAVFNNTPASFILFFFILYTLTLISFCFMMSTLFSKARTAALTASLIAFLLHIPFLIISSMDDYIPSNLIKLILSLASTTAVGFGIDIILIFETYDTGMQWKYFLSPPTFGNTLTIGHVVFMMIFDAFFYFMIALYVEQVSPGTFGIPRPWYFPIQMIFAIFNRNTVTTQVPSDCIPMTSNGDVKIEAEPIGLNVGINIQDLSKSFDDKVVVDKLKLRIFENQITVLLGHNGAGKTTTISMLVGMFPPTSGTATVAGFDIRKEIVKVRDSLSICPQHDILFPDLTVAEHIIFFSRLKGVRIEDVPDQVDKYINLLDLKDKRDVLSSALSGGMQRRLSVGTAICGNSRVVLLDEPSSGLDPGARRQLWDILHKEKNGRTIILTTHFMDEAEILGERVAIMSSGKIRCVGSPFYLKKKFGMGYRLIGVRKSIPFGDEKPSSVPILKLLKKHVPEAKLYSDIGSEVSFVLPEERAPNFYKMLIDLENEQLKFGLDSFGLSASSLEEVFMNVGADIENDPNNINDEDLNITDVIDPMVGSTTVNTGVKLIINHWKAMFLKRILMATRSWSIYLAQLMIPIIFIGPSMINDIQIFENKNMPRNLDLSNGYQDSLTLLNSKNLNGDGRKINTAYVNYFKSSPFSSMGVWDIGDQNMSSYYNNSILNDFYSTRSRNLIGASIQENSIVSWYSNFAYHDVPASILLVHNAIIKGLTSYKSSFTLTNHPLLKPETTKVEEYHSHGFYALTIAYLIELPLVFLTALFAMFYVKENKSRSKLLQRASGVSPIVMWGSALIFDLLCFLIISILICSLLLGYGAIGYSTVGDFFRLLLLLMLFGWAFLPMQYIVSTLFKTESGAFVKLTSLHFLSGFIFFSIKMISDGNYQSNGTKFHYIFMLSPHYCIMIAIFNSINIGNIINECKIWCNELLLGNCSTIDFCTTKFENLERECCVQQFEWKHTGIMINIVYMILSGFVAFMLLMVKEYNLLNHLNFRKLAQQPISRNINDLDVIEEHNRVKEIPEKDYSKYHLLCKDLTKYYGKLLAVNQISIAIKDGECFGLLGKNGAGKTTTFKMLTGELNISSGTAWVKGYSVNNDMKTVYKHIGYCPQFDALLDDLTGRETLKIFSLLRGIPYRTRERFIENISKRLGFEKHLDKIVKTYSGGNKRKLSISIALIGNPDVVYLDEPTTGMDPSAKRLVWKAISKCRCVVLTSHSMEECEALCSRIVIMTNGSPQCLGSLQHLKNKFSQGYTLMVKLRPRPSELNESQEKFAALTTFLTNEFSIVKTMETCQDVATYHLPDKTIKWSTIFSVMESAKVTLNIEDYSIGQTSLEQIFLRFTENRRINDDEVVNV